MTFENSKYYISATAAAAAELKKKRRLKSSLAGSVLKKMSRIEGSGMLMVNTNHCKAEYALLKEVIRKNKWKETN